jgi:hypothetical protein
MSAIRFVPLPTPAVRALQAGGPDAHGMPPERHVSDGEGNPCRHCLREIPAGAGMLVLAWRPFPALQPYAETGPVFLCADPCAAWEGAGVPPVLTTSPDYMLRGYGADGRIVYGTGGVVPSGALAVRAAELLADPGIAFVHVRSARNGCFQCRIDRA